MALSQSAVSDLLDAFRAGDGVDLIRESVRLVLQELIEVEATEVIGAGPYERSETRSNERTGHVRGCWRRRPATSSSPSPSSARARSSRRSSSPDGGSIRPSTRW